MSSDIDHLIDRRFLRRKITFWRFLAIFIFGLAVAGFLASSGGFSSDSPSGAHIARVEITGAISHDRDLLELLDDVREDDDVKGVILSINSPGGTTVGGESLFNSIRMLAEAKPTVSSIKTLATSAAYMAAAGSDHIVAHRNSIVGSIGVLIQYPEISVLLDKIGVKVGEIKSSRLKAEPSLFTPGFPESDAMLRRLVEDSHLWFKNLVKERRALSDEQLGAVADGSIFSGRQALSNRLVDALGGEEEAVSWLRETGGLAPDLEVIEHEVEEDYSFGFFARSLASFFGIDIESGARRLFLDGLVSVWHN